MGQIRAVSPVKLLAGLITADLSLLEAVKERLEKEWGPVDSESDVMDFTYTRYYEAEMGSPLYRRFLSFQKLIDPGTLAEKKVFTNSLESEFARAGGKRTVNIDPGYLAPAKLVLATTKDRSHRIYLGQGIYAEVTLLYYRGKFEPLPWTYPDYRTEAYREYFARVREIILRQEKGFLPGRGEDS
ncbi:MAG: DUF4416 family protein [Bacillota bacterium]